MGDKLIRCSATVLKSGNDYVSAKEGYGDRPYDNWEVVMFDCRGEDFNTGDGHAMMLHPQRQGLSAGNRCSRALLAVMSALGSNNPRWGINEITIELQRGGEDAGGAEEP